MTKAPDADFFYGLYDGVFKPQLVKMAIEMGVFEPLAAKPLGAREIASALSVDATGVERLADYLVAIRLLDETDGLYSLTPSARAFLVRTSKAYAGDLISLFTAPHLWTQVLDSIKAGEPRSLLERFDQDAWVESYRQSRIRSSLEMWRAAGIMSSEKTKVRILDLASGCGIKTFCLAQKQPSVHVSCVDSPQVMEVAGDLARRMEIAARVRFIPGDILTVELGTAQYEGCLAGQITHYLTAQQNRRLFARVHDALVPEGVFVIDVPLSRDRTDESTAFLSLVLWANSGGRAYSFEEYEAWLLAGAFRSVRQAGTRWVIAVA